MFQKLLDKAELFLNPSKYYQDPMMAACQDGDLELIQAFLKKGASLRFQSVDFNDPAYGIKIFLDYSANHKKFEQFVKIAGGITPKLLTRDQVFHFPLLDWIIKRLHATFEEQEQILECLVKFSTLEALHLLEAQSNKILTQSSDNPFNDLNRTIQLAQLTLELVQVNKEKQLLEKTVDFIDNTPIGNTPQSPKPILLERVARVPSTKRFKI